MADHAEPQERLGRRSGSRTQLVENTLHLLFGGVERAGVINYEVGGFDFFSSGICTAMRRVTQARAPSSPRFRALHVVAECACFGWPVTAIDRSRREAARRFQNQGCSR